METSALTVGLHIVLKVRNLTEFKNIRKDHASTLYITE